MMLSIRLAILCLLLCHASLFAKPRLVNLATADPTIRVEMRYARADNFLKRKVYDRAVALLQPEAAQKLLRVQRFLKPKNLSLKIWDAYRPHSVQVEMWHLVPDERFVANPAKGSTHNRGTAVDVTLVDAQGKELDMGTAHDDFSPRAFPECPDISLAARRNRRLLRDAMVAEGFEQLPTEWWHFNLRNPGRYPVLDLPLSAF